jgi:hypothetical protein
MSEFTLTPVNPGSDEAIMLGCTCAVLDNCHGAGFPIFDDDGNKEDHPGFWVNEDCPIHGSNANNE